MPRSAHAQQLYVGQSPPGTVGEYNATTGAAINANLISLPGPTGLAVSGNDLFTGLKGFSRWPSGPHGRLYQSVQY